jgi:hypothetical protein
MKNAKALCGSATTASGKGHSLLLIKFCRAGVRAVKLRPRICHLLSLLRIHSPNCKHCSAHLICGNELRKRLEELNEPSQPDQFQSFRHRVDSLGLKNLQSCPMPLSRIQGSD